MKLKGIRVPGVKMKLSAVEDKLRWAAKTFNLVEMCFDPWGNMVRSAEVLAGDYGTPPIAEAE